MLTHTDYRFSVSVKSADLDILGCMRAIAGRSQQSGNPRIAWGGTTDEKWRETDGIVTFHFSHEDYRMRFINTIARILPNGSWQIMDMSDQNAAVPQQC